MSMEDDEDQPSLCLGIFQPLSSWKQYDPWWCQCKGGNQTCTMEDVSWCNIICASLDRFCRLCQGLRTICKHSSYDFAKYASPWMVGFD